MGVCCKSRHTAAQGSSTVRAEYRQSVYEGDGGGQKQSVGLTNEQQPRQQLRESDAQEDTLGFEPFAQGAEQIVLHTADLLLPLGRELAAEKIQDGRQLRCCKEYGQYSGCCKKENGGYIL